MSQLTSFIDAWRASMDAVLNLDLTTDEQWQTPTDLPGWTCRDVLAHLVHLEEVIVAGGEPGPVPGGTILASDYTDSGVASLRGVSVQDLRTRLRTAVDQRATELATATIVPGEPAPATPGGMAWTWETALRNRAVDAWMHEQDIRRAVSLAGGLDSPGAVVTTHTFAAAMGFVLGKKAKARAGTVARWEITGPVRLTTTVEVGADGRARPLATESTDGPTVTLTMDTEAFTMLCGGRRSPEAVTVQVSGDATLGKLLLDSMTLTF